MKCDCNKITTRDEVTIHLIVALSFIGALFLWMDSKLLNLFDYD